MTLTVLTSVLTTNGWNALASTCLKKKLLYSKHSSLLLLMKHQTLGLGICNYIVDFLNFLSHLNLMKNLYKGHLIGTISTTKCFWKGHKLVVSLPKICFLIIGYYLCFLLKIKATLHVRQQKTNFWACSNFKYKF